MYSMANRTSSARSFMSLITVGVLLDCVPGTVGSNKVAKANQFPDTKDVLNSTNFICTYHNYFAAKCSTQTICTCAQRDVKLDLS
jgi:hypothetical protein